MAFDIDLKNWAIDFDLQDRAMEWCKNNNPETITWPPSGRKGLKKAHIECIPFYLLAYSHKTTISRIEEELTLTSIRDFFYGDYAENICKIYRISLAEFLQNVTHYIRRSNK